MTEKTVVIVGASAAGLRCACRLARVRPEWEVVVFEERDIYSYAACGLSYVLSGDIPRLEELRDTEYGATRDEAYFETYKGVKVLAGHRVTAIDTSDRRVTAVGPDGEMTLAYDELVLATGARPRMLPGIPDHPLVKTFHAWEDVKPLKMGLARGEIDHVVLVGAGLIGCELAEAFHGLWGADVTLVEAADHPLRELLDPEMAACLAGHLVDKGIRLVTSAPVERIEADDDGVTVFAGNEAIRADAAVVAVGVEPLVDLAEAAGLRLGPTGAIAVDEHMATSVPHVWAAGDCVEVRHVVTGGPAFIPLGSLANRQGRVAANAIAGRKDAFPPVAGASAVKIFDWNVASVGITAGQAAAMGLEARSAWISCHDRAHYWPESKEIHLTLIYEPGSLRVLGVQAAGEGDTSKRVDVATQWIARGATLEDLAHVEHAYAPPYAPALDPISVAAFVALNQEDDGIRAKSPDSDLSRAVVLDVRLAEEIERRPVGPDGAPVVPLGKLRERLSEVDAETDVVVCERGPRSAEAVRILHERGIRARFLGGGMHWKMASRTRDKEEDS